MTNRKKKLRIAQISFLIIGIFIIFFTYFNKTDNEQEAIVSKELQDQINKQLAVQSDNEDIFYNIEYAGLDLAGNRYILKSEEVKIIAEEEGALVPFIRESNLSHDKALAIPVVPSTPAAATAPVLIVFLRAFVLVGTSLPDCSSIILFAANTYHTKPQSHKEEAHQI